MALRLAAVGLAVCVAISYGAVLRQEDDILFDTIQSFLVEPDNYVAALGFSRSKRSSGDWDKEFNLNSVGASVKIKYDDPENQLKGGKAQVVFENLKKYVKRAKSSFVKLDIKFDGGDSPRDGLFSLEVEYELHHDGVEKGKFEATRSKSNGLWMSSIKNQNTQKPNGKPILPTFEIKGKSDRKTMASGTYNSQRYGDYVFNVDRVPGKSMKATIEGEGRVYVLDAQLNKAEKKLNANLDANGFNYQFEADFNDDGKEMELNLKVNLGNAGIYSVDMSVDYKKFTKGSLEVKFNNKDFAKLKMKGKLDKSAGNAKYEIRYSTVAFGEGKLRFSRTKNPDGGAMKAQFLPKTGLDLVFDGKRVVGADNSMNLRAKVTRGGENYLEYNIDLKPDNTADGYQMNVESQFDVNEKSLLYPVFCSYGCFKRRSLNAKMFVNKDKPYKIDFDVHLFKDAEEVLTVDIDTRQSPYVMKLIAPRILPKILPTGRKSIEFEADHVPGKYLHVKSNTNMLSSFNVDKLGNGMRKVELNGKELMQADFSKGDNTISQTTTLPDGRSLTTTVSWDTDDMKKNKVNLKLDGTERQLDANFEWDFKNTENLKFKGQGNGQNKRWGKYMISRDVKMSAKSGVLKLDLTGHAEFEKFWMPSPVETVMKVMLDTNNKEYMIDASKTFNGKKMGLTLNNGKLSLTL